MSRPHAQDEASWEGAPEEAAVTPPAPANQWTPHDGGIEPAPPAPTSVPAAVAGFASWFRDAWRRLRHA